MRIEYSWKDLRPVHPLWCTVLAAQASGALANLLLRGLTDWYDVIWQGGAVAGFFGFVAGLVVQWRLRPGSLSENRSVVALIGVLAFVLLLLGLFMPLSGGAAYPIIQADAFGGA